MWINFLVHKCDNYSWKHWNNFFTEQIEQQVILPRTKEFHHEVSISDQKGTHFANDPYILISNLIFLNSSQNFTKVMWLVIFFFWFRNINLLNQIYYSNHLLFTLSCPRAITITLTFWSNCSRYDYQTRKTVQFFHNIDEN